MFLAMKILIIEIIWNCSKILVCQEKLIVFILFTNVYTYYYKKLISILLSKIIFEKCEISAFKKNITTT